MGEGLARIFNLDIGDGQVFDLPLAHDGGCAPLDGFLDIVVTVKILAGDGDEKVILLNFTRIEGDLVDFLRGGRTRDNF